MPINDPAVPTAESLDPVQVRTYKDRIAALKSAHELAVMRRAVVPIAEVKSLIARTVETCRGELALWAQAHPEQSELIEQLGKHLSELELFGDE